MTRPTVLCDALLAECTCTEALGHDGPHVCRCGGSWRGDDRDGSEIEVVHLPQWIIGPGPESVNHSGFVVVDS